MRAALDRSIASPPLRPTLPQAMALLRQPKVALAVLLGLATGMPPVMVTVTLGFWLRSEGIALAAIGYLSWVGLFFSFKFLWAPLVDALRLPWLARRLGHRRAWMLLGQLGVIVGILGMAATGPGGGLGLFAAWAMLTALASATQDIAVDAWRIESAAEGEQEVMASAYVLGVRLGYFAGNVPIFAASAALGWPLAYACAALGGLAGLAAVVWAREPAAAVPLLGIAERAGLDGLLQALWRPLPLFWQQHGRASLLLVPLLALYFVPDGLINAMVAPLYADLGFNARQIAVVRGLFGFPAMLLGVVAAGWLGLRWGSVAALATGVSLAALSNVGFALLAWSGGLRSVWVPAAMFEGVQRRAGRGRDGGAGQPAHAPAGHRGAVRAAVVADDAAARPAGRAVGRGGGGAAGPRWPGPGRIRHLVPAHPAGRAAAPGAAGAVAPAGHRCG